MRFDTSCPYCGARFDHPNDELDIAPITAPVGCPDHWKQCVNPDCIVDLYDREDGTITSYQEKPPTMHWSTDIRRLNYARWLTRKMGLSDSFITDPHVGDSNEDGNWEIVFKSVKIVPKRVEELKRPRFQVVDTVKEYEVDEPYSAFPDALHKALSIEMEYRMRYIEREEQAKWDKKINKVKEKVREEEKESA